MVSAVNDRRLRVIAAYLFQIQDGCTALIWAASNGHTDCVRLLVEGGADKDANSSVRHWAHLFTVCFNWSRFCALCLWFYIFVFSAVNDRRLRVIAAYLFQIQDGCTALIWAASNGHTDCVRLLVEGGADKDAKSTVRHWAHLFTVCFNWSRFSILFL